MWLESVSAHVYLHLCVLHCAGSFSGVFLVCNISFSYLIYTYTSCVHALYALFHLLFHTIPGSRS